MFIMKSALSLGPYFPLAEFYAGQEFFRVADGSNLHKEKPPGEFHISAFSGHFV
jgi:hypothetical protein